MFPNDNKTGFCIVIPGAYGAVELTETSHNIYISLFTIQYGRNDNEKKNKKHSQQTITHYDSDITCPEISSDDEQAGHSANQSKTLPDIEQQPVYH